MADTDQKHQKTMKRKKPRKTIIERFLEPGLFGPNGPSLFVLMLAAAGLFLIILSIIIAIHPTPGLLRIQEETVILEIPVSILSLVIVNLQMVALKAEKAVLTIQQERSASRALILKKRLEIPSNAHILMYLKMLRLDETAGLKEVRKQSAQLLWTYHPDFARDPQYADLAKTCRIIEARSKLMDHFRRTDETRFVVFPDDSLPWNAEEDLITDQETWLREAGRRGKFFASLAPPPIYKTLFCVPRRLRAPDLEAA